MLRSEARHLPAEVQAKLALAAQGGDVGARNTLIESNAALVVLVAGRYAAQDDLRDDLVQEGHLGMLRAVDTYQPGKGRFSTWAAWWIRAYMERALTRGNSVVYRRELRLYLPDVNVTAPGLDLQDDRPSPEDLAIADLDGAKLRGKARRMAWRTKREDPRISDLVKRRLLAEAPETLQALGNRWGCTRERSRQVEAEVLRRLKRSLSTRPRTTPSLARSTTA